MNNQLIAEVSKILMSWSPLGPKAKSISDLDNYHTEAIDILFAIEVAPNSDSIDRIVQDCLFHAIRPPNPRRCGHLIHDYPAGQSTAKRVVAGAKRRG